MYFLMQGAVFPKRERELQKKKERIKKKKKRTLFFLKKKKKNKSRPRGSYQLGIGPLTNNGVHAQVTKIKAVNHRIKPSQLLVATSSLYFVQYNTHVMHLSIQIGDTYQQKHNIGYLQSCNRELCQLCKQKLSEF